MNLLFVHGWGFAPDIWTPLCEALPDHNHHFIDLGFIDGFEQTQNIPKDCIIVAHSLGVLWAIKHIPAPKAFISIAGFKEFENKLAVKAMIKRLKRDPYGQMTDFWSACESPLTYTQEQLNIAKLEEGLQNLLDWNANTHIFDCPFATITAKNDAIIQLDETKSTDTTAHWLESGGHALPLTQTKICAGVVEGIIDELNAKRDYRA